MPNINWKIAFRSFFKNKVFYLLNLGGLSIGLAVFILVSLYINNEVSYDQWNKNIDHIFLVERELPNGPSPYTPGKLAAEIKRQCPEVIETGRMNTALFQIPFFTPSGRFLIKKWVGADYSISKILGIEPQGFKLNPNSTTPTILLSKATAKILFPGAASVQNKTVNMMSRSGMPLPVAGVAADSPGNTNFEFDCIGFSPDITSGKEQSYATQIYQTFLLVKPQTDIKLLSQKIDAIYREAALTDTSKVAKEAVSRSDKHLIYLDPLKNLHLKPHYGSHANNFIVNVLATLAIIILIATGINFTNLYISQATKRAKEVGIKKVNGIVSRQIIIQFLTEILVQCLIALGISIAIVYISLPGFNQLLSVNLFVSAITFGMVLQVITALLALTILAGLYPALVMSRFKPAEVLRGNILSKGGRLSILKGAVSVIQITFALIFVIGLVVVNQQVKYMQNADPGFSAKQILYIDNLALYNNPRSFEFVRQRITQIPGVKSVTVASNVPSGLMPVSHDYSLAGNAYSMSTISVDYDYFETLNIKTKTGHIFNNPLPGDSLNAVINEAAAKQMNLKTPVGNTITGCGSSYKIIGVIKDVKANGYEENVTPTIYLMNDHCGLSKTQIMIGVEANKMASIISTLNAQWPNINKLDGDNFNYHFLDELYGKLFVKQQQLKTVLTFFSALAIFIAALGLFSLAAHTITTRMKELAIRKIFGASGKDILFILSKPFFTIILLSNLIAWPIALILTYKWLQTFSYRINLSFMPFELALIASVIIVVFTVCFQVLRALKTNTVSQLKV
ncbi:ABC transporter permease [Mucilaginibacter sp. KACC 22063]|uniref:ABC transporter permease n=1 Tax=Mucilaginibacter sp. KACC 22063 TaxID=3025666 RepID=UPI00236526C3|nr:ABC transporter permease [Mucilaginibacter sp. KACC 22063]WDF53902.1 ABC transporter permease [Mucilaginibacter sp. KACC 22063]